MNEETQNRMAKGYVLDAINQLERVLKEVEKCAHILMLRACGRFV